MASKVEILGGQLDGSVLDNAASESTLKELVDAIKKLDTSVNKNAKAASGGKSGSGKAPEIDTDGANKAVEQLEKSANKSASALSTGLGSLSKAAASAAKGLSNSMMNMAGLLGSGNSNLSSFVGALGAMPGALGGFATALASGISALEQMQETQRDLSQSGASFNNSMLDMRIAAAESGLSLSEYAGFVKSNSKNLAGFGNTITEGAQRMAELGNVVGQSGISEDFMRLGMSASQARLATMQFSANLVKGDKVRSASAAELAGASLAYESQMDMLSKQTGQTRDSLKKMADDIIKDSGALTMSFAGMGPDAQAAMKGVLSTVSATMGEGAKQAMIDMASGAAVGTTEASRYFTAQMPEVAQAFKDMEAVAKDTTLSKADREKKLLDLQAKAQVEQQKFLQTEAGQEMMANKAFYSGAQRDFITGLEKNQQAMLDAGYDIKNASVEEIQAKNAAKKAEQARQDALDAGMNRLQDIFKTVGSALQTGFFKLLKEGLNSLFTAIDLGRPTFEALFTTVANIVTPIIGGLKMFGDELLMIGSRIGPAIEEIRAALAPVVLGISEAFTALGSILSPVSDTLNDNFWPAVQGVSDFIQQNMTPILSGLGVSLLAYGAYIAATTVAGWLQTAAQYASLPALMGLAAAAWAAVAPFIAVAAPVLAAVAAFVALRKYGWEFGTVLEAIKDSFKSLGLGLESFLDSILTKLPGFLGGISEEEAKTRKESRDVEAADLKAREDARDKRRAQVVEERKTEDQKIAAQNATVRQEKAIARDTQEAAEKKKDAVKSAEIADAMERSKQAGIARMRELAGISGPAGTTAATTTTAGGGAVGAGAAAAPINQDVQKNLELMKASLIKQGITDPKMIAATLGNVMKESGGKVVNENLNYGKTDNSRIRSIFGDRAKGKTDEELNSIKGDPQKMGEMMYGSTTKIGMSMGNNEPGDGFKFRGRGFIQLTGKSNYAAASKAVYGDDRLVKNPDMLNDPQVAADVSAWYMKRGTANMAAKMGIDPTKDQASANLVATSVIAGGDVRKKGDYVGGELVNKVNANAGSAQIQAIANGTSTAVAGAKPGVAGGTAPNGTAAVAATGGMSEQEKLLAQNKDRISQEQQAQLDAKKNQSSQTSTAAAPAGNSIAEVIASLNTNIAMLTQLQARAVSIAEQQLRATNGLSRDAYKAV